MNFYVKQMPLGVGHNMPLTAFYFFSRRQCLFALHLQLFWRSASQSMKMSAEVFDLALHDFCSLIAATVFPRFLAFWHGEKNCEQWNTVENHGATSAINSPFSLNKKQHSTNRERHADGLSRNCQ